MSDKRTIQTHQHDAINRALTLTACQPGRLGAPDLYIVSFGHGEPIFIPFQAGAFAESGINGATCELYIAAMLDRLEAFQAGPLACPENAGVIHHLRHALDFCVARSARREKAGVKGTSKPIPEPTVEERARDAFPGVMRAANDLRHQMGDVMFLHMLGRAVLHCTDARTTGRLPASDRLVEVIDKVNKVFDESIAKSVEAERVAAEAVSRVAAELASEGKPEEPPPVR